MRFGRIRTSGCSDALDDRIARFRDGAAAWIPDEFTRSLGVFVVRRRFQAAGFIRARVCI